MTLFLTYKAQLEENDETKQLKSHQKVAADLLEKCFQEVLTIFKELKVKRHKNLSNKKL